MNNKLITICVLLTISTTLINFGFAQFRTFDQFDNVEYGDRAYTGQRYGNLGYPNNGYGGVVYPGNRYGGYGYGNDNGYRPLSRFVQNVATTVDDLLGLGGVRNGGDVAYAGNRRFRSFNRK